MGRVVTRDLKGMARSCLSHTSLCVIWHLYGEWVGTVYLSLLACVWGGGMDLDFRCCEQKDFVAAPSQGLRQTLCSF